MQSFESSTSGSCDSSIDFDDEQGNFDTNLNSVSHLPSDPRFNLIVGSTSKPKLRTKVVIIGGGLSGLAAAQRLWSQGIKDIILLEAQDCVGGRVQTIKHSGGILELGAQYFHGAEENPIYNWVNGMVKLSDFEDGTILMQGRYFTATGEQISPNLVSLFLKLIMNIKSSLFNRKANETNNDRSNGQSSNLSSSFDRNAAQEFRKEFQSNLENDACPIEDRAELLSLFEWFLRSEAIENGCDQMDEVSMASYIRWTDFSDGATLDFRWGYQTLLRWFLNQIPVEHIIHLNCEVTNVELIGNEQQIHGFCKTINQKKSGPVVVHYRVDDEVGHGQQLDDNFIECSHVIMTASIGYLKCHLDTLFSPPLPLVKQELIKTIGYGTVNKIFLHFEDISWLKMNEANLHEIETDKKTPNVEGVKLVWRDQDFDNNCDFPIWSRDITSFERVKRQENLFVAWIGGRGAKLMERESDWFIGQTCVRILKKFLSNSETGVGVKPIKLIWCLATRWFSNPYTCGSYSFQSMDSQDKEIEQLHEPIYCCNEIRMNTSKKLACLVNNFDQSDMHTHKPAILFAGEATAGELYSTTHGAILSGWREADQIIASNK